MMNEQTIREYAALMKELGLTAIEVDESRDYFRLECDKGPQVITAAPAVNAPMVRPESAPVATNVSYNTTSFKSPIVGVFYAAPTEDAEPFVKVGDQVKKGDTLCIIEAMKLMNEVVAENDGVIEAICVENGQLVEYGTELFRIKEMDV